MATVGVKGLSNGVIVLTMALQADWATVVDVHGRNITLPAEFVTVI